MRLTVVDIPLPDDEARLQLLQISMKPFKVDPDLDMKSLADKLQGYSGSDISNVR